MLKTVSELREYRIVGCLMTPTFSRQYYSMTATCLITVFTGNTSSKYLYLCNNGDTQQIITNSKKRISWHQTDPTLRIT